MDAKQTNINDLSFTPGEGEGKLLPFSTNLSSNETSAFIGFSPKELSQRKNYIATDEEDNGFVELGYKYGRQGALYLEFVDKIKKELYTPDTRILARFLFGIYTTTGGSLEQSIPLSDYFKIRGITDNKENRKTLKQQLKTLSQCRLDIHTSNSWKQCQFIVEPGIQQNRIVFTFGASFVKYIMSNISTPPYPQLLYSLKGIYDINAFLIGDKLTLHKYMNLGRANEFRISVDSLLKVTDLPTEEYVKYKYRRDTKNRISTPFINALEVLNNLGGLNSTFSIKIETPEGKLLSFNGEKWRVKVRDNFIDYDTNKLYDYQQLRDSMIDFDIVGYPKVKPIEERLVKKKAIERQQSKKK